MHKLLTPGSMLWPLLVIFSTLLYLDHWLTGSTMTRIDDAYMYIRYADNLIAGNGYSWNGDINTYGCTSISYALFITLGRWLRPDMEQYRLLALSAGFWGVASIGLLGFTLARIANSTSLRNTVVITALLAVYFAFSTGFQAHVVSGMDTTMSLFSIVLLVLACFEAGRHNTPGWFALAALAGWFAILTRPDNGIIAALLPGLVFLWIYRMKLRQLLPYYVAFTVLMALDTLAKFMVFGDPIPLPYHVKLSGFYAGYVGQVHWNPVKYINDMMLYAFPFITMLLVFVKRQWLLPVLAILLPLILTWLYYFRVVQIMGNYSRFYYPGIALLAIAAFMSLDRFVAAHGDRLAAALQQCGQRLHYLAIASLLWTGSVRQGEDFYAKNVLKKHSVPREQIREVRSHLIRSEVSKWSIFDSFSRVCAQLPAGTVLAATEHGRIAAENPDITVIDLTGLHSPKIARNGFSMDYLQESSPDLIWMPHNHYVTLNRTLLNDAWFRENYYFIPGVFKFGIAVRRGREDLFEAILPELEKIYKRDDYIDHLPAALQTG